MQDKQTQQEQQLEQHQQQEQKSDQLKCAQCGYINEPETRFCGDCGSNLENKTRECPVCAEIITGIYCEFCGANSDGYVCSKCNIIKYTDFCAECGEPLSETALNFISIDTEKIEIQEMSEADAALIIKELNASLTPAMQKEQEKKRQRIILLREREYFNEREKRIEEFYSSGLKKIKTIDPEEMKLLKKSVERLRGYVRAEKERVDEEIRVREEKERIAEEKRKQAQYMRRIEGVWVMTSGSLSGIMKIYLNGSNVNGNIHFVDPGLERVDAINGTWNGNTFKMRTTSMRDIWKRRSSINAPVKYSATVNSCGDTMNGYMEAASSGQLIFIKQ